MNVARISWTASVIAIAAVAVLALGWLLAPSADANSARVGSSEAHIVASINQHRIDAGLPPLHRDATLTMSAGGWTDQMVDGSFLGHAAPDAIQAGAPGGYDKLGENVGRGSSAMSVVQAFMRSSAHRSNILDPSFTHVGAGLVVHPSGQVYTTVRFASIPGAATPPAATGEQDAPPPPAPEPAPTAVVAPPESTPVARDPLPVQADLKDRGSRRMAGDLETRTRSVAGDEVSSTVVRGSRRGVD